MIRHNSYPLRFRLIASFVLLISVCLLSLSILGSLYYQRDMEEQNVAHSRQMLEQVQRSMDAYVRAGELLIGYIQTEPDVISYLRLNVSGNMDEINADASINATEHEMRLKLESSLRQRLSSYATGQDEIGGILVCNDKRYSSYGFFKITHDSLSNENWYSTAIANPDKMALISAPIGRNLLNWNNYATHDVVMLAKAVVDPQTKSPIGVVSVDLKLEGIEHLLSELKLGPSGTIFILDKNGDIVYTPTNPLVYRVRPEWFSYDNDTDSPVTHTIRDNDYLFLSSTSDYSGWQTIALFPYGIPIDTVRSLQRMIFLVTSLALLFATVAANLVTRSVTKPLFSLQKQMQKAEQGDLDVYYENSSKDEVGKLGASFNAMMDKIRALIEMVTIEQHNKREAELSALQAQINPHFLYNTLDTIQWMGLEHNAPEIVEIVGALTRLFRISLSRGKEFIPLREELEHVKSYLYIQKMRYEDKLQYEMVFAEGFDEQLLDRPVLKLLLQPLVENAIYHGIKQKSGPGMVRIVVGADAESFFLQVVDDGVGMSESKYAILIESLQDHSKQAGYGTFNVHERLTLHFGEKYGLNLYRREKGGIVSEIRHPLLLEVPQSCSNAIDKSKEERERNDMENHGR